MALAMRRHIATSGGGEDPPPEPPPGDDTFITDQTAIYSMPTLSPLQRLGWYVDSTFGTTVTKISDYTTMSLASSLQNPYGLLYEYSSYVPISKNGTYITLFGLGTSGGGWHAIYRVSDGTRMSVFFSGGGGVDPEFIWDPLDDNVGYYLSSRTCYRMDMPAGTSTALWTVQRLAGGNFTYLRTGQEGRPSDNMRWHCLMGYMSTRTVATTEWVLYDRLNNEVHAQRMAPQYTDAVKTTPVTGQFVGIGDSSTNHTVLYDQNLNFVRELHKQASHEDAAIGSDGEEYLVYMSQTGPQIAQTSNKQCMARVRISDGTITIVPGRVLGSDKFPTSAVHISGIVSKAHPDWVLVSHYTSDPNTNFIRPGDHEVWLQNFMTGDVKRICHTHNWPDADVAKDYWAETQATSNWAGDEFLMKSNWGTADPNKDISVYKITGTFW